MSTSGVLSASSGSTPCTFAAPSASIGLSAVNGTATTCMTSDSAPALSQAIVPTWTGFHTFSGGLASTSIAASGGIVSGSPTGGNEGAGSINAAAIYVNGTPVGTNTGTVSSVSVVSANGLSGTVATATTTPAITLAPTWTGIGYSNGTGIAAAVAGNFPTLNQATTGNAATATALAATPTQCTGSQFAQGVTAAGNANCATPSGVSILAQSGIPFILSSSGSVGNNCAITGLTAMQTTYASAYIWMPLHAISAASAAGWYYAVMSSATAGTCYNNAYTSGQPEIPGSPTAFSTTGPGSFTQTISLPIVGPTISVPANSMGLNGELQFDGDVTVPATTNGKQVLYEFGGSGALGISYHNTTTVGSFGWLQRLRNRGNAGAQVSSNPGGTGEPSVGVSVGPNYLSIDTTSNQNFSYAMQLTTATDYIVLESFSIKELPTSP